MTEPILSRSQERRISVQKGTVTPERLAEIMYSIEHSSDIYEIKIPYTIHLAHELLKTLDIREKE